MSPTPHTPPNNHHPDEPKGYSLKPVVFGATVMCALLMGSFWVYIEHPEWLEGSSDEDERVEKILEANPDLSREDLEADLQSGDLSFWLRTDPENAPQSNQRNQNKNKEPDPLEVFMKKQRQEAKKKKNNSSSNNPLLNFSSLDELASGEGKKNNSSSQIGDIDIDTLSLSTPLDRMLRGETGNQNLTPLEAEILSLQQSPPTSNGNPLLSQDSTLPSSSEEITDPNSANNNIPSNQPVNNPATLLPNSTPNFNNNSLDVSSPRQRSLNQPSLNQTTRRGTINPLLNGGNGVNTNRVNSVGTNGVNGVVPTTPVVPQQNSRRTTVSPRVSLPTTTTTPTQNNTGSSLNDPFSNSQPTQLNQPVQTPRRTNPNNRIGGGEINSFSNPYGTGQ